MNPETGTYTFDHLPVIDYRDHQAYGKSLSKPGLATRARALGRFAYGLALIAGRRLADYEHLDRPSEDARTRLAADALASPPRFNAMLALIDGRAVGYAVFFETYSTFLALPTLYLEDLFVLPDFRGRGIGMALFKTCAVEAVRRGCGRMEWQVLAWNTPSIAFYERLGWQAFQWTEHFGRAILIMRYLT